MHGEIELGLGLISIGRSWGFRPAPLPSDARVDALLTAALGAGIRFFDTAPSYGSSEERLGRFLRRIPAERLRSLTIATKCGEHQNAPGEAPYADHGFEALARSIDSSLERLPAVQLLQIHKSTAEVLRSGAVRRAVEHARASGVREFGASVTDLEAAAAAAESGLFHTIQFFFNRRSAQLAGIFEIAARAGMRLIVNRPFAMGALLYDDAGRLRSGDEAMKEAFAFVLRNNFRGVILTGTSSAEHLRRNVEAFRESRGT
jgi:aryl-alcohol dehydrogenase-like predicted oxidoreductase